jgi:hypothetical protein
MFQFTEPSSSGQFLKTHYWYIQRVRTLWDPILFRDYFAIKAQVEFC